jgi:peptidoglycan hydrolase-like protein with peptidoglycan-binding domain
MEITKNQKIVGISLAGVIAWLLYRKKVRLQSQRVETPSGPTQVVVPVATGAGTGAIANVLGNVVPTAHSELVTKALSQVPVVVQGDRVAPTRVSTIADMQHALNFLKVCSVPLKDSGVLDAPTVACLKAFQSIMQIPITGLDDPTTKSALESAVTKSGIGTHAPAILAHPTVISPPHVNPVIQTERDLQRSLNVLGASPKLKEDGKIGPVTTAAIKAFQVVHGLVADGLPGPKTKATLAVAVQGGGVAMSPAIRTSVDTPASTLTAAGEFGYLSGGGIQPPPFAPPAQYSPIAPPLSPHYRPHAPHAYIPPPTGRGPLMPEWEDPQGGQFFAGDFGVNRGMMQHGGGFHPHRPMGIRGRAWGLGVPYEEDADVEVVEIEDEDGSPVLINGEQLEAGAMWEAHRAFEEAHARGDRRFEHPSAEPGAPPLPWEHRREEHPAFHRGAESRGWGDRLRDWFGFGQRRNVDENQFIPPPATPQMVNWDPFSVVDTVETVDRWHPDELRRKEELERRGYSPHAPITPGIPRAPAEHLTPPGPPPGHPAAPAAPRPAAPTQTPFMTVVSPPR